MVKETKLGEEQIRGADLVWWIEAGLQADTSGERRLKWHRCRVQSALFRTAEKALLYNLIDSYGCLSCYSIQKAYFTSVERVSQHLREYLCRMQTFGSCSLCMKLVKIDAKLVTESHVPCSRKCC